MARRCAAAGAKVAVVTRPVVIVTGASRPAGIGAAIAVALAADGWDVAITSWTPYDGTRPWRATSGSDPGAVVAAVEAAGARAVHVEADLADPSVPAQVFERAEALGPVTGLVVNHCESTDSGLYDTTVESFDRHHAVNVRATWLLLRELGLRFPDGATSGRAVTLTSDHVVGNLPYGATKAAANAVALAAAAELGTKGITVNAVNPGPTDTGWFTPEVTAHVVAQTMLPRQGETADVARLVRFLLSADGGWVTGQLLYSNGGFRPTLT